LTSAAAAVNEADRLTTYPPRDQGMGADEAARISRNPAAIRRMDDVMSEPVRTPPFAAFEWLLSGRYLRARRKEGIHLGDRRVSPSSASCSAWPR
jgi:hypothetical protein